jgi:hypothetical protein
VLKEKAMSQKTKTLDYTLLPLALGLGTLKERRLRLLGLLLSRRGAHTTRVSAYRRLPKLKLSKSGYFGFIRATFYPFARVAAPGLIRFVFEKWAERA